MTASSNRPARLIREGWQVRLAGRDWATVARVLVAYSPLVFVRLDFTDGDWAVLGLDYQVRSRTLTDQARGRRRPRA